MVHKGREQLKKGAGQCHTLSPCSKVLSTGPPLRLHSHCASVAQFAKALSWFLPSETEQGLSVVFWGTRSSQVASGIPEDTDGHLDFLVILQ